MILKCIWQILTHIHKPSIFIWFDANGYPTIVSPKDAKQTSQFLIQLGENLYEHRKDRTINSLSDETNK